MASTIATIFALVMVIMQIPSAASVSPSSECKTGFGSFPPKAAEYNRKILMDLVGRNREVMMKVKGESRGDHEDEERVINGVELRRVPSGPDPLHHNVGSPRKPRSSP
ncbi:hypothetical protein Ancab_011316 [Ancistrocladus abbreviatus]